MTRVLFLCSRNRLRSPTADQVFSSYAGLDVASAGLSPDAESQVTPELIEWAEIIFVMERVHRRRLSQRFGRAVGARRVICLDIPDRFEFMDPALVEILKARVLRHLPGV